MLAGKVSPFSPFLNRRLVVIGWPRWSLCVHASWDMLCDAIMRARFASRTRGVTAPTPLIHPSQRLRRNGSRARYAFCLAAARRGDAFAQVLLGNMYRNGEGIATSFEKATRWYELAACQSHPTGLFLAGACAFAGHGCERDETRAIEFWRKAAQLGSSAAARRLGAVWTRRILLTRRDEVAMQIAKAKRVAAANAQSFVVIRGWGAYFPACRMDCDWGWLKTSERLALIEKPPPSDGPGFLKRAMMYGDGVHVDWDLDLMTWCLKTAAEAGEGAAMMPLAMCHFFGLGVAAPDKIAARRWAERSAKLGGQAALFWMRACWIHKCDSMLRSGPWYGRVRAAILRALLIILTFLRPFPQGILFYLPALNSPNRSDGALQSLRFILRVRTRTRAWYGS